ncbi:MAG: type IV pilus assembly protein PilM [Armatimonadota bacterium]|jgi:type IV pilus assembly protein PilM
MARGATHVLGLDIGTAFIKAAEIQLRGDQFHVVGRPAVIPTPPGAVRGGVIVDAPAVAEVLQEIRARYGAKTKKVVASVGGDSSVVVRITEVPRMSGKELDEAIQWELDEQTPFPVDEVIYDYAPIERADADPEATEMEVLMAVAQEDLVTAHVEAIQGGGMQPVAIDVEPLAIGRAIVDAAGDEFADQTVVNVHIGATNTLILIFRHRLLSFVRVIPSGGENLSQAIGQSLMLDHDQSEVVKLQLGNLLEGGFVEEPADEFAGGGMFEDEEEEEFPSDSVFELSSTEEAAELEPVDDRATHLEIEEDLGEIEEPPGEVPTAPAVEVPQEPQDPDLVEAREHVAEALTEPVLDMATEVRRSLDFYRRQHRNEPIDRIVITGGSANLEGLAQLMTDETGVTAEIGNPFQYMQIDDETISERYLQDIGPSSVIAVGLAIRDMVSE